MLRKSGQFLTKVACLIIAIAIPVLLMVVACQAKKNSDLRRQIEILERKQENLQEKNKKLVGDIGQLTSVERIQKEAQSLGMKPADTNEIVRVDMNGGKNER